MIRPDSLDAPELASQISAIAALNEPVRPALYAYVLSRPEAVSREEAGQAVGIARELAAFHLDRLLEHGLLDVEYRHPSGRGGPGAGRPATLYRPSDRQLEITLPDRRYELAASLLAEAFAQQGTDPAKALDQVAHRFGAALGAEAKRHLGRRPSSTRILQTTCAVLRGHGFNPTETDGAVQLHNCPFQTLAEDQPGDPLRNEPVDGPGRAGRAGGGGPRGPARPAARDVLRHRGPPVDAPLTSWLACRMTRRSASSLRRTVDAPWLKSYRRWGPRVFANPLGVTAARSVCLLVVDGLGWQLLRDHAADARSSAV